MTALTSLLVLATLFTQVSASLPKTSYFKMVDIWLLFCILVIFIIIIFHTLIDFQVDYGDFPAASQISGMPFWKSSKKSSSPVTKIQKVDPWNSVDGASLSRWKNVRIFIKKTLDDIWDLDSLVSLSKIIIFIIFLVFNLVYWGILAFSSGLVYNFDNE